MEGTAIFKLLTFFFFIELLFLFIYNGIKAMGCRNSPLTIKPYPMKIRGEYILQFLATRA